MKNELLYTDRLVLRKAKESDLKFIYKNVWSDVRLTKYMLWQVTNSIEEAQDRLSRTIAYQNSYYAYFVCLKETDEVIGFAGIIDIGDGAFEDTGICIATEYQAKGFGKEVVEVLADLIFNKLNGNRFVYSCFSDNIYSKKLAESLGFKYVKSEEKIRDYDNLKYVSNIYYMDKNERMNKAQLLALLEGLKIDKEEFTILSSAGLVLRGIMDTAGDLDIAVSDKGFEQLKKNYDLKLQISHNYAITDKIECIVEDLRNERELIEGYYVIDINSYLEHIKSSKREKDKLRIPLIESYIKNGFRQVQN